MTWPAERGDYSELDEIDYRRMCPVCGPTYEPVGECHAERAVRNPRTRSLARATERLRAAREAQLERERADRKARRDAERQRQERAVREAYEAESAELAAYLAALPRDAATTRAQAIAMCHVAGIDPAAFLTLLATAYNHGKLGSVNHVPNPYEVTP